MDNQPPLTDRIQFAINRCEAAITWYQKHQKIDRISFYVSQTLAIALGGLTPVVIALDGWKWAQALLPALGAIAAALGASFGFRENWVRFGIAAELLKSELAKFRARSGSGYSIALGDEAVLSNFVDRTEGIILSEATQWKADLSAGPEAGAK
jgi:hypothetical protein